MPERAKFKKVFKEHPGSPVLWPTDITGNRRTYSPVQPPVLLCCSLRSTESLASRAAATSSL